MGIKIHIILLTILLWAELADFGRGLTIKLENGDPSPGTVSAVENTRLVLYCEGVDSEQRIVWSKGDDKTLEIFNTNLTFISIELRHAGTYQCTDSLQEGSIQTVAIKVLYPPHLPSISGSNIILKGSSYNLKCSADSDPEATFYWTTSGNRNSQVLMRGFKYSNTLDDNYVIYCWAENTMFPTTGNAVTSSIFQKFEIKAVEAAHIVELNISYTFNVGSDLMIDCRVSGSPHPSVWWTRDEDPNFLFKGERLFLRYVQIDFTGYYTCNAQNTLNPTGEPEQIVNASRHTLITITDTAISEDCRGTCQRLVNDILGSCSCSPDSDDEICDSSCRVGLFSAAILGWVTALVLFLLCLFGYVRRRDQIRKDSDVRVVSKGIDNKELLTMASLQAADERFTAVEEEKMSIRPVLPVRPDIYRRSEACPSLISDESIRRDSGPFCKINEQLEYEEPSPSHMRHDYLQLDSPKLIRSDDVSAPIMN